MKLFIILAAVAWCNAAKLENTYLPPSHSQSSGGSGVILQTPLGSPQGQNGQGFDRNGERFSQSGSFGQSDNGFGQSDNGFGQSDNGFGQNGNGFAQKGNGFSQNADSFNGNNFNSFESRRERPRAAFERTASILRQDNQNDGETYSYAFETENGIYAEENGVATNGVEAQGEYSYTGDDGQVYSVRYTADQNGFVPQGEHLPTPPPVPEDILKALEQNARDEAAGIFDDGLYSEGKYSDGEQQNNENNYNNGNNYDRNNQAFNNQNESEGDEDSVVTTNALFRESGNGFNNGNSNNGAGATSQTYLPPVSGRGNQGSSNGNGPINRNPQRFDSGANQGANQAYLPPPPFAGQRLNNGRFNGNSGAHRESTQAYLPSFAGQRDSANHGSFNNGNTNENFNSGESNQGFEQANKAYLPPQRTNGFGSRTRPSFSARNGYRY